MTTFVAKSGNSVWLALLEQHGSRKALRATWAIEPTLEDITELETWLLNKQQRTVSSEKIGWTGDPVTDVRQRRGLDKWRKEL